MISLNEIRKRAIEFSHEWEREYSEDAEAKSFWDGFFDIFGVSRRRVASFEYPVKKLDGGQGFIDVLWKGMMIAEHKSRGRDLDKAYTQAKDYFPKLKDAELPKYIIVSDFEKIRLYDLEKNTNKEFLLKDFHKNIDLFDFISGYTSVNYEKEEEASIKAARLMADFHNEISKTGYAGHDLEVFLIRILFCLFADDTEIFNKGSFHNYIENRINKDGSDLGIHLGQIFHILNTKPDDRQTNLDEQLQKFPYINGGIFAEQISPVSLDATAYLKLLKCCSFDWSNISASIFGSLFQGVMSENERRQLGAHYTSELNILKVIHPLFLDELYIEFDHVKFDMKKLEEFHKKLSKLKFLDPACGCGNFLVVAYRELRKLELDVLLFKRKNSQMMLSGAEELSIINVNQFYGIEIEEFPALVARTAMYLVDHQMNQLLSAKFGQIYARIPLREPATIVNADALTTDWEAVISKEKLSYILGNPPFVGARLMEKVQKENFITLFDGTLDTDSVVLACLFHDMGNIIKSDLNYFPDFLAPEGLEHWQRVKAEYIDKYGEKEHVATIEIAKEISLPPKAMDCLEHIGFVNIQRNEEDTSFEYKICNYADLRVGPHGVISIDERLSEGSKRYAGKEHAISSNVYEQFVESLKSMEKQIFEKTNLKPEDINDEKISSVIVGIKESYVGITNDQS